MKDYHVAAIALGALIALAIVLEWLACVSSRRATRENRCQLCGQTLPTKGGDE